MGTWRNLSTRNSLRDVTSVLNVRSFIILLVNSFFISTWALTSSSVRSNALISNPLSSNKFCTYIPISTSLTLGINQHRLTRRSEACRNGRAQVLHASSSTDPSKATSKEETLSKNKSSLKSNGTEIKAVRLSSSDESVSHSEKSSSEGTSNTISCEENNEEGTGISEKQGISTTSLNDDDEEEILITDEDVQAVREELKAAVKEVKEGFQNLTESTAKLKDTIIDNLEIKEVKESLGEVKESASGLAEKVIDNGPGIINKAIRRIASRRTREDFVRRRRCYASDWTDALKNKRQVIPAVLFLYFACLAPIISFGTIASQITNGSIGVLEFLISAGFSGMAYAVLCGQPMAFIAPTGLTLAFISGLFNYCSLKGLPFFPVYAWVGIWTSIFMTALGLAGSSKLIRYCTRFTDEVFNALLSVNFIYEALYSLRRNFQLADPSNLTMPFLSLNMALATCWGTMKIITFNTSRFLNKTARTIVKDFGPVAIIFFMSFLNALPSIRKFGVPTLTVSNVFELAGGRDLLVPINSIPLSIRLLCALPATLLTSLFFMDQNISVRLVNNPQNGLKKGPAYNLDMMALGLITGGLSLFGLPWMCGATVQSMNHVRAMTTNKFNVETGEIEIEDVTESRLTGFIVHAMIASTVCLLPSLRFLPIPVVSGVFLFLGRKLMTGNTFLGRIKDMFAESQRLPEDHCIHLLGRKKLSIYTLLQIVCLMGLWAFKSNSATSIFFPSVIGVLMAIRGFVLPRYFSEEEFIALGDETPKRLGSKS